MNFNEQNTLSHPALTVLDTMIHKMEDIVPFLPSVESIETLEKGEESDGKIRVVRRWQGTSDSAPAAIRGFLSREHLAWIDTAIWTPAEWKVDWTLSTSMSKLYDCGGANYYEPEPADPEGSTRMRITGELVVYPERLPGIPKFLARKFAPQVEKFVINLITPNLTDVAKGLQGYLDEQG